MIDENSASYISPEIGATAYHCPHTNCDGHFYVSPAELGKELTCQKCGLAVAIGTRKEIHTSSGGWPKLPFIRNLNYRRGLQRIYILFAVAWVIVVLGISIRDMPPPPAKSISTQSETGKTDELDAVLNSLPKEAVDIGPTQRQYWEIRSAVVVAPPAIGYLLLFIVLPWIRRGFEATAQA